MTRLTHSARNAVMVKANNLRLLLITLVRRQPISRVRLARETGLSSTTVTNLVAELKERGIVAETGTDLEAVSEGAGRPPVALRVVPSSATALGVHMGVRRVRVGLVDLQVNLLEHEVMEIDPAHSAEETLLRVAELCRRVLARRPDATANGRLAGVGVGASGLVEYGRGVNLYAPNLGWRNVPIQSILEQELGVPVAVDNNVRCMALAESLFGVGRNARALAFIYARVGVGSGLVVDGDVYRGADNGAGEIGHWVTAARDGDLCSCGNRGCLETFLSELVLLQRADEVHPCLTHGRDNPLQFVFESARDGHLGLVEMLEERAYYLGLALANLVNVLNPEVIMLGGWFHEAFDLIEPVVVSTMRHHAFGGTGDGVRILPSSFGDFSGVAGAATLALDSFFFTSDSVVAGK